MLEVTHSLYHFSSAVRLGNEQSSKWELVASGYAVASYDDDVYCGPFAPHQCGQLQAVHGPWQADICDNEINIVPMFQNCESFLRASGRDWLVSCSLKHKFQVLTGKDFILNDQNGTHTAVRGKALLQKDRWKTLPKRFAFSNDVRLLAFRFSQCGC